MLDFVNDGISWATSPSGFLRFPVNFHTSRLSTREGSQSAYVIRCGNDSWDKLVRKKKKKRKKNQGNEERGAGEGLFSIREVKYDFLIFTEIYVIIV